MPNKDEVRKAKETYIPSMRVCLVKMDDPQAPAVGTEGRDSVYESLKVFDRMYSKMSDLEKKNFVRSFIDRIELEPKVGRHGMPIKNVKFKFPVAFDGSSVYEVLTPSSTTDETLFGTFKSLAASLNTSGSGLHFFIKVPSTIISNSFSIPSFLMIVCAFLVEEPRAILIPFSCKYFRTSRALFSRHL